MSPVRNALLDAAYDAAVGSGWGRARMGDVASAAGVSRQTLYTEFGSKDGLAQALALREAARFVDGSEAVLTGCEGSPSEAIAASTEWTLRVAREDPLIKAVLTDDGTDGLLPYLTTRSDALLAAVTARNVDYLHRHWPELPVDDIEFVADTLVRLTVSHIVSPAAPADVTAQQIAHLVDRLLPGGTPQ
ncbi:MAG: TetR family transcriptional regulator [Frankiaceae bacterium]|nr:TetR family transcriptional regulator [Frankiaceae bacterium]